jgi:hypothetical protein
MRPEIEVGLAVGDQDDVLLTTTAVHVLVETR